MLEHVNRIDHIVHRVVWLVKWHTQLGVSVTLTHWTELKNKLKANWMHLNKLWDKCFKKESKTATKIYTIEKWDELKTKWHDTKTKNVVLKVVRNSVVRNFHTLDIQPVWPGQ